jgi:hypothetical protein
MAPVPPHLIEDDDGPSPLDEEGLNPFGGGPFGEGPFGPHEEDEDDDTPAAPAFDGTTILQRHKVDLVAISKKRWLEYRAKWEREGKPLRKVEDEDARRRRESDKRRAEYRAFKKREREEAEQAAERRRTAPERARRAAKAKREREATAYAAEVALRNEATRAEAQFAAVFAEAQRQAALEAYQSQLLTMAAEQYQQQQYAAMMREEMAARYRQALAEQQEEQEVLELLLAA